MGTTSWSCVWRNRTFQMLVFQMLVESLIDFHPFPTLSTRTCRTTKNYSDIEVMYKRMGEKSKGS